MPPPLGKKIKGRDGRRSSSRHTTPSSTISAPMASPTPTKTAFLDIPISDLAIPTNVKYEDILERHGGNGGIPDPKHLETIADNLKMLAKLAQSRTKYNDMGMRALSLKRKEAIEQEREREMEAREQEQREMAKRQAEEEEAARERKNGKSKKKDRSRVREEKSQDRPLNHGAHGLARQDGSNLPVKASSSGNNNVATTPAPPTAAEAPGSGSSSSLSEASPLPSPSATTTAAAAAATTSTATAGAGSVVAPSGANAAATTTTSKADAPPPQSNNDRRSSSSSSSSDDTHQPAKAASLPQFQTFGPNPLAFDDPTVYEIKKITPDMTDEEKREACAVSSFPPNDLSHLIAGIPPDKDFSNGGNGNKPANQVQAHTFASYLEPYLRPLKEEDINFLKERGDRVTPFIIPRRGTKHYRQVWAEEDGMDLDPAQDQLNPNQARGSIDQMNDEVSETDQVSGGPMLNRLLSTMRYEHRPPPNEEKQQTNGIQASNASQMSGSLNGDTSLPGDDLSNFDPFAAEEAINTSLPPLPGPPIDNTTNPLNIASTSTNSNTTTTKTLPPATFLPETARVPGNSTNLTHAQIDDRIKLELRHLGILGPDDEPDYDAHYDDAIAQRLRYLQGRLKEVSILNGARKQRLLEIAEGQAALQEYNGILEDLDSQVQGAYLKSLRTASRSKKNTKRPGGAGGGSHASGTGAGVAGAGGVLGGGGVSKPGIGDVARQLMKRRTNWEGCIGPVFSEEDRRVRGQGESVFGEEVMKEYVKREKAKWDEEVGE